MLDLYCQEGRQRVNLPDRSNRQALPLCERQRMPICLVIAYRFAGRNTETHRVFLLAARSRPRAW